jgi:DNA-binding CsgD family transcriptional regulator
MVTGEGIDQVMGWQRGRVGTLAPRELEVVRLAACGLRNWEIAAEMGIETSTVRTYLQWIFVKLGVRTRVQLALVAVMVGVVDGEMVVRAWERYAPEVLGSGSYRQMDVTGTGPG